MFNIPELDSMVCSKLALDSLAKCAQVNKAWSRVLAPFVWHTIPEVIRYNAWFCQQVLEDLLQERQYAQQKQSPRTRWSTRAVNGASGTSETPKNTRPSPSPLIKNGRFIHQVQCATMLLTGLERVLALYKPSESAENSRLTAKDLVRHFLERCPNALMVFEMTKEHFDVSQMYCLSLEILPRVDTLVVTAIYNSNKVFPVVRLKQVLTATSNHLESLTINTPSFRACIGATNAAKFTAKRLESEITSRPKKLKLLALVKSDSYTWLWHACGQVQELEVGILPNKVYAELVNAVQHSMPSLDTVTFCKYVRRDNYEENDQQIAFLVAAGTKGWKAVHCGPAARVGVQAVDAVLQHALTLEEFSVAKVQGSPGLARVLQSCPKLRVFKAMATTELDSGSVPSVPVADFIDWDQEAKALRRWKCKTRVETLAVRITDFPLRVRQLQGGVQEGDQRVIKIQQWVFQRLGQFRNLKVLQLGHSVDTRTKQFNSARLTLEHGLEKLLRLKKLEELHIYNMDHHVIEKEEVRWMVEHWPKLRKVIGLYRESNAYRWLKRRHPEIQQRPSN
ncbi:hypothetical protein BGZ92_010065 [Podila epicladia]|nr:hypothetical protein BGZ92_010065 [Podila epicladia]